MKGTSNGVLGIEDARQEKETGPKDKSQVDVTEIVGWPPLSENHTCPLLENPKKKKSQACEKQHKTYLY